MLKRFALTASAVFLVLAAVASWVGERSKGEIEALATSQFNQQQLILAQKIARDIELQLKFLNTSLIGLTHMWRKNSRNEALFWRDAPAYYELMRNWDVLAVALVWPWDPTPDMYGAKGLTQDVEGLPLDELLAFAAKPAKPGDIYLSKTIKPAAGPFAGKWIVLLATPVDPPEHERAAGRTGPGLVVYVIDAVGVAGRSAKEVRSGQTGYAWVIDHQGVFLSHYEDSFVGQNSLTVRARRDPGFSYQRINDLVTGKLLKGEQGMDWYSSGWHRDTSGEEVVKLIAYAPVHLEGGDDPSHLWSVGLAAPVAEAKGLIGSLVTRQYVIAGLFFAVVFTGLSVVVFLSLRFSRLLKTEVELKTSEIRQAESQVRQERDKVALSLQKLIETQKKLLAAERFAAIGEAAAHLSHEIKNPLMIIGGFAARVRKDLGPGSAHAEKLTIIEDEARRLEAMLTEVRDFTRPAKPQLVKADLAATVDRVARLTGQDLAAKGISLDVDTAARPLVVLHDPDQIGQVLLNLIKNAAEAMTGGGAIGVTAARRQGRIAVTVRDNGPGLPPELHEKIFSPFYTTKEKGTGLGLCVCSRIMADHGGAIEVQSEPGQGCSFTLAFPEPQAGASEVLAAGPD